MVHYEHKRLAQRMAEIEVVPSNEKEIVAWLRGDQHLQFLRDDVRGTELTIAALGVPGPTCLNSFIVPVDFPLLQGGALPLPGRSPNPYHQSAARYSWGWGDKGVSPLFETGSASRGLPPDVTPLVFFRSVEGDNQISREVAQDFVHVASIIWHRERKAYSRFDHRGDWLDVISYSTQDDLGPIDLISVHRETLDLHLTALGAVLVRVFEFDLNRLPAGHRLSFKDSTEQVIVNEPDLQYRGLSIDGQLNRIRGAQIVRPRLTTLEVEQLVKKGRILDPREDAPVEFDVLDWRNGQVTSVATDPATTTNYFAAHANALPLETSPAMFRPEVLLKYKGDTDKYSVRESWIGCRASWLLKRYSINDAGQVAVYICDLRDLPHEELLHWKSFNEEPKAGLSARTIQTDFMAKWPEDATPREQLVDILQRWSDSTECWWTWRPEDSPDNRVVVPHTNSRNEWESAIGQLSNDVIEGFNVKELRGILKNEVGEIDKGLRSISLLERILWAYGAFHDGAKLTALRELNQGRNLGPAHAGLAKSRRYVTKVLEEEESFEQHYEHLCNRLTDELRLIEQVLAEEAKD